MRILYTVLFTAFINIGAFAQVIDDSDLKKLESGQYQLDEGKIQVTFLDTISFDFMQHKLHELGYEVLNSDFQNIMLSVENDPKSGQLSEIEDNEWVDFIMSETSNISDNELEEISKNDSLDDKKVNLMLAQLNHRKSFDFIFISLNHKATAVEAYEIIGNYPELDIKIVRESQRTAIIKTELEKEAEAMEKLGQLDFVKSTAYLGVID